MLPKPKTTLIANNLSTLFLLPFVTDSIPGRIVEEVVAHIYGGSVLPTYDFVDVYIEGSIGWQVKSTKEGTPITWKRAKIRNKQKLIEDSHKSTVGRQKLGDAIIKFCNTHAVESIHQYGLDRIVYSRCIVHDDKTLTYFERNLLTSSNPIMFNPRSFAWKWSTPKVTESKEQLPALHGYDRDTGKKMWAWHGLGENQLHFSGEGIWWNDGKNLGSTSVSLPSSDDQLTYPELISLLK